MPLSHFNAEQVRDRLVSVGQAETEPRRRSAQPSARRRDETGAAPLSFSQERLWFLDQINPGDPFANICALRLKGPLEQDILVRSLSEIVKRHESLRTTFATTQLSAGVDSKPAQLVAESKTIGIPVIDLRGEPVDQREAKARDAAQAEAQRSFDLTMGPLLRATLLRLSECEHVLLINLHPIVGDDWSLDILFRDLLGLYSAALSGENPRLPQLPIQYSDYASWQRTVLDGDALQAQGDYWRAKLQGAPPVIELPTDRPRPAMQSWRGASVSVVLNKELSEGLHALSEIENATLFMTLLAAFQVMLSRYTRQHDVVVGSSFVNRELEETRNLIGPFSNDLALRTDLSGNPTFRELLARVKTVALEANAHRAMPFEKLVEELQLERSLSHAPVFQVLLNLKEPRAGWAAVGGLSFEELEFETGISKLDLTLDIVNMQDRLNCRFEYGSDLFDRETIDRSAGHFEVLLKGVVRNPDQRISDLPLLTEGELRQTLVEWNNTKREYPREECIHELFEAQVHRTPNAIAVEFEDQQMTYAELNRRSNQLAHYLRGLGVGPEVLVGICVNRSMEMLVGLLGILKSGGAYVPLDPAFPKERLAFMVEDANVAALLTQQRLSRELPPHQAALVCLDSDWEMIARGSTECPSAGATAENLAYVIYTSGSTGNPKGVGICHQALTNLLCSVSHEPGLTSEDTLLSVTTLSFDIAGLEFYLPLIVGARLIIVSREVAADGSLLKERLAKTGATVVQATPATWQMLVDAGWQGDRKTKILCGGEALSRELANQLLKRSGSLWNMYGPTETTIWSTAGKVESEDRPISIGRPLANTQIYLLDESLSPVPPGVAGELHIGGDGLARGYLNRPELTAEKFIQNPFGSQTGTRMYRTGDLTRYLPDGSIEYLGRIDNQVKIRGFRIELGEIEAVLRRHAAVREAVVQPKEGNDALIAYVVVDREQWIGKEATLTSELRGFLAAKLPEYMVPARFAELDALPLTPNGKVDRRALPKLDDVGRDLEAAYIATRDNLERQLANIWEKFLNVKPVGVKDSFFELGGHSLLAVRLFAQIENRFGKHLPLATLFQSPTIEQLANVLREDGESKTWSSLVAIQPQGSKPPLFCVHAAGANVLIYRPLSRHLGNDQPVYALQAQGLDGQARPYTRVEDMAAHYIEEMRAFQHEGPYFLIGASFGGLVIYEMAHQLLAQGQRVAFMGMLNTNCPLYTFARRVRCHLGHLIQHGPRFYFSEVSKTLKRRINKPVTDASSTALDRGLQRLLESHSDGDGDEALVRTVRAILEGEKNYVPTRKAYPGKITLFWANDAPQDIEDNRLAWRRLATGGFEVHFIPGNHASIREEPNVAVLVEKLKPCLERAQYESQLSG